MPFKHLVRYSEIIAVFIRYGLGFLIMEQIPRTMNSGLGNSIVYFSNEELALIGARFREALTELGPTFIKLGQLASTRTDILPQPMVNELTKLQDRVRPFSFGEARLVIEQSLQRSLDSVFPEFDPSPIAAASIAQVHQAILNTGEKVAVKVQRPVIREKAKVDLEIFSALVTRLERTTEWGKRYPLRVIFNEFAKTLLEELDFTNEGRNAERLAQLNRRSPLTIPKVYWEFSNASVLVQEYISGRSLYQMINEKGLDEPSSIAREISQGLLQQIMLDGCFHGDPHPGNILIMPGGGIALIDFGILGTLTPGMRKQLTQLFAALIQGKDKPLLEVISQMGIVPEQIDRGQFLKDVSELRSKHVLHLRDRIEMGEGIRDFFNLINRHGIYIPSEFILVGKSLLTLEGILYRLDPDLSLFEQMKPYTRKSILRKFDLKYLIKEHFKQQGGEE